MLFELKIHFSTVFDAREFKARVILRKDLNLYLKFTSDAERFMGSTYIQEIQDMRGTGVEQAVCILFKQRTEEEIK